ncbi:hypothetical protein F7725_027995 [Dissostichus mawsoni]|uniref:Pyrin domain-containing protein n=1 Tax=Dissostichus mawsoni TaxID=36200 RepID=A0A7J5XFR2_DISMA|nr:hypothetical protein F7725_027995 [Dissostichus mawsoni]
MWLMKEVKVHETLADKFFEEEVSGSSLDVFGKTDILDLGIKHGPAVKITSYLESLKKGSRHESQFPAYVENWTKQQVTQWLLQHVKVYDKYAETLREEDVTGDCLILAELHKLNNKPEPPLQPISDITDLREKPNPTQPELSDNNQSTRITKQNESETDNVAEDKSENIQQQFNKASEKDGIQQTNQKDLGERRKEMIGTTVQEDKQNITLEIKKTLDDLFKDDLKEFNFYEFTKSTNQSIPRGTLEGKDTKDTAKIMTDHYGTYEAVQVTIDILLNINQRRLACDLEKKTGKTTNTLTPTLLLLGDSVIPTESQDKLDLCNGRHDLDSDLNKELDYKNWLRKSCRDVEQLVSFICNHEVFLHGRSLIIFLLLSPVVTEKDPIVDIYKSFIKHIKEESIINICESQSTYQKWRELIQEKCDFDIECLSINELTLSEINGTIMALGPFNQSSGSAIALKQKDEDFITALDILCLNQCENTYDENSEEFQDFRKNVEEEFFRGGKVKWWNFYFCDKNKDKPFIKRDKYGNVKKMIRSNLRDSKDMCVLLNLFHQPGCGGTTLAMHVMWDLRHELRCAVLKDNTVPKTEVATQVKRLMKLESEKPSPVLLLVDDSTGTENPNDLVSCIQEQKDFEKKLKELKETHEKPESFYSFMIMKSNFDKKYIDGIAHNTLENFDFSQKEAECLPS